MKKYINADVLENLETQLNDYDYEEASETLIQISEDLGIPLN